MKRLLTNVDSTLVITPVKHRRLTGTIFIDIISTIPITNFSAEDLSSLSLVSRKWRDKVRGMLWVKHIGDSCYEFWKWDLSLATGHELPSLIVQIKVYGPANIYKIGFDHYQSVAIFQNICVCGPVTFNYGRHVCHSDHGLKIKRGKNNSIGVHNSNDGTHNHPEIPCSHAIIDAINHVAMSLVGASYT